MTKDQYDLLIQFPCDKSFISHKDLEALLDDSTDFNDLVQILDDVHQQGYVVGNLSSIGVRLTVRALQHLAEFNIQVKRDAEIDELKFRKLKFDVTNAERIFKTYWLTFSMAVIALLISVTLLVLKLG